MIAGSRQLPVQHITVRVPWHDNGWKGTFCNKPCVNSEYTKIRKTGVGCV